MMSKRRVDQGNKVYRNMHMCIIPDREIDDAPPVEAFIVMTGKTNPAFCSAHGTEQGRKP